MGPSLNCSFPLPQADFQRSPQKGSIALGLDKESSFTVSVALLLVFFAF